MMSATKGEEIVRGGSRSWLVGVVLAAALGYVLVGAGVSAAGNAAKPSAKSAAVSAKRDGKTIRPRPPRHQSDNAPAANAAKAPAPGNTALAAAAHAGGRSASSLRNKGVQ